MKLLVGLSGGLDSTYAAYLMKAEGHEVIGVAVRMHDHTDLDAASRAAEAVGIPLTVFDARERFQASVISYFLSEYTAGRTPNPCVMCNPSVKFGVLCDYAEQHGIDAVVTGHYASVLIQEGRYYIRADRGNGKDQSYVLWGLSQKQLAKLHLPLAGLSKAEIRQRAMALGFPCAEAKESQEICFIPDNDYIGYIERALGKPFPAGDFIDADGKPLGRHRGLIRYTVGQRKGLGIALGQPMFVSALDADANTVTLVPGGKEYAGGMTVRSLNFMKLAPRTEGTLEATVKVRYAAPPVPCTVIFHPESAEVVFDQPIRAVAPGQSAVFYEGDDVLFGGSIAFT